MATTATTRNLRQYSLAEIARQHAEADDFLARLKAIPTDGMSDKDLLSHRLLERQIEREDMNYELKNYEMPVNQQNGVHTRLADLPLACLSIPCSTTRITFPGCTRSRACWIRRPR